MQYFYSFITGHLKSLVMICYYKKNCIVIDYISNTVHFISIAHLFCNLKFVPLNISHLFLHPKLPSPRVMILAFVCEIWLFINVLETWNNPSSLQADSALKEHHFMNWLLYMLIAFFFFHSIEKFCAEGIPLLGILVQTRHLRTVVHVLAVSIMT